MNKKVNTKHLLLGLLVTFLISGCGVKPFISPASQPIIQVDNKGGKLKEGEVEVIATTAQRRLVVMRNNGTIKETITNGASTEETISNNIIYCAEPSPDAQQSIASLFGLDASSGKSTPTGETNQDLVTLAFNNTLISNVSNLFYRSQGVQFYRDGLFALCQMAMNGFITKTLPKTLDTTQVKKIIDQYADALATSVAAINAKEGITQDEKNKILKGVYKAYNGQLFTQLETRPEIEIAIQKHRKASKEILLKEIEQKLLPSGNQPREGSLDMKYEDFLSYQICSKNAKELKDAEGNEVKDKDGKEITDKDARSKKIKELETACITSLPAFKRLLATST